MNLIQTKPLCASSSNLVAMLTMVNPTYFGGHSSKVKVTLVIIDKCEVRGDATLCVVIFNLLYYAGFILSGFDCKCKILNLVDRLSTI